MRRTIALALVMIFGWTPIAPVFGPDADANLPPCCRRHGKHHCMMRMMEQLGGNRPDFTSVTEKCPYWPVSTCAVHSVIYKPPEGQTFCAGGARRAASATRPEARPRLFFLRGNPKRGPPIPLA
ncbi:MAG: hypothetical protein WB341_13785 [Terracidiphilus sp.]